MTGRVENRQAVLPITLRRVGEPDLSIEFIVDTGYTGYLTLPPAAVTLLGLPFLDETRASLANDESVVLRVHGANILWDDVEYSVEVIATGKRPLLGTALLDNLELVIQFCESGIVTVGEI